MLPLYLLVSCWGGGGFVCLFLTSMVMMTLDFSVATLAEVSVLRYQLHRSWELRYRHSFWHIFSYDKNI